MCRIVNSLTLVFYLWIVCDAQMADYFTDSLNSKTADLSAWHQRYPRVASRAHEQLACEKPHIYFCEEPPDMIPPESTKRCNYRNTWHQEQVFRWVAGRGCLVFTPPFLFVGGRNPINLNAACVYGRFFAPCLEIAREDGTCACYPFDPGFEEVATAVRNAVVPSIHGRWERCFYGASDCCSHFMNENQTATECPPTFDGWTCWEPAPNGSIARSVCPEFAYSNSGPTCHHFSHKECHANSTWELQTDYSTCSITPRLLRRYRYFIAVFIFSVITSFPAICIFIGYKRLRVTRVALHRNLLVAIVLRNIIVIISRDVIYVDELTNAGETIMSRNGVACRILSFAERLAGNAVFVCMLMEGIFLHRLIVAVFKKKLNIKTLYLLGTLFAILPAITWAIVMSRYNDHSCWLIYTFDHLQWILDAPRLLVLVINAVLYVDVLRVIFTKIRNHENANQLSTAKATLFLMPLFGVQFLFTMFRPHTTNCNIEQFYYIVAYTIEGLQGFIVALLYCYINKEVHTLLKDTYKRIRAASRIKDTSSYPRISGGTRTNRRLTYTSALNTTKTDDSINHYSTVEPKLHVAEIISIQASERLAEILDPIYETIDNDQKAEGYEYLEQPNADDNSRFRPSGNFVPDEYYGFTNASSISIGCPEWLRRISASSSDIDNNSIIRHKQVPNDSSSHVSANISLAQEVKDIKNPSESSIDKTVDNLSEKPYNKIDCDKELSDFQDLPFADLEIGSESYDNMLDEIMECMENDNFDVKLNPDHLSPNRTDGDKIVFLN